MAILREQFKPVAQSYPVPDALCQLPGLDVVHFARLTVLKVDALAAQPQSTIIHGAFHLLIHVVELQSFCHADLALLVPPKLLGGRADGGRAGDLDSRGREVVGRTAAHGAPGWARFAGHASCLLRLGARAQSWGVGPIPGVSGLPQ